MRIKFYIVYKALCAVLIIVMFIFVIIMKNRSQGPVRIPNILAIFTVGCSRWSESQS